MDPATISAVVLAVATIIGLIVAYIQWRENHSDRAGGKLEAKIKNVVTAETKSTDERLHDHTLRLTQTGDRLGRIEGLLTEVSGGLRKVSDDMIEVKTKLSMYGTAIEQLAMNSAKNMHQPDPRRAHVDALLEAFMEGTLTADERLELRKILVAIRNWEPKDSPDAAIETLGFPVYPGEQTSATILLSTMDLVDPERISRLGHSSHRSAAHREK